MKQEPLDWNKEGNGLMRLLRYFIWASLLIMVFALAYSCFMSVHSFHDGIYSYEEISRQKKYPVQFILWAIPKEAKDISYRSSIRNGFSLRMKMSADDYEAFCQNNNIKNKRQILKEQYYDSFEKQIITVGNGETGIWLAKHPIVFTYDFATGFLYFSCHTP